MAGLNLLSQISDVMSSKDWQGISQLFGSFFFVIDFVFHKYAPKKTITLLLIV